QALTWAKWPQPRNGTGGRRADSGEGWLAVSTRWPLWSGSNTCLACACAPHSKKALGAGSRATRLIRASVTVSQPRLACEVVWPATTLIGVLTSSTLWLVQRNKSLPRGSGVHGWSSAIWLKTLRSLGGR